MPRIETIKPMMTLKNETRIYMTLCSISARKKMMMGIYVSQILKRVRGVHVHTEIQLQVSIEIQNPYKSYRMEYEFQVCRDRY